MKEEIYFSSPWFEIMADDADASAPYYVMRSGNHVTILPIDTAGNVLLVKQYRIAVNQFTLELPSGHVDAGESHFDAAMRELREETGHEPGKIEYLGAVLPDTGRRRCHLHCYVASELEPVKNHSAEAGMEVVTVSMDEMFALIRSGEMNHALDLGLIGLWMLKKKT